jgi:mono/diheme cytochrome c family protein
VVWFTIVLPRRRCGGVPQRREIHQRTVSYIVSFGAALLIDWSCCRTAESFDDGIIRALTESARFHREVYVRRTYFPLVFVSVLLSAAMSAQESQPLSTLPAAQKAGRSIFQTRCAMCHVGQEPSSEMSSASERRPATMGPLLSRANTTNEAALRRKIKDGSAKMPGYKYTLSDEQVDQVVAFMKSIDKPLTRLFAARPGE